MAGKRVLGDDPFAAGGGAGAEAEGDGTATVTGAKARASKRPAAKSAEKEPKPSKRAPATAKARASTAPRAKGASDTETAPEAEPTPTEVPALKLGSDALRAPAVPREAQMFAEAPAGAHPEVTPASATPASAVAEQLASIESQLAELMARAQGDAAASRALDRLRERLGAAAPQPAPGAQGESPEAALVARHRDAMEIDHDGAREVLGTEFYRRHWGRSAMRDREEEVDDFGLDPKFSARWRPLFDFLYERWWRVEARGVERVPERGAVILCANHAGAVPYDGVMLSAALRREHAGRRELRWLAEDFVFHAPFLGVFMNRLGAVRACQENAARLLSKGACVGVFPEGIKGISKPYGERYKLQRFGRGGHVKLAMRTNTTIVPVAIVGAEETHPMIAPSRFLGEAAGLPFVPLTPTFPWLGPLGLVPLPSKWTISFLDPVPMAEYGRAGADDEALVGRVNERIRGAIQDELDRIVASRGSAFRG